MRPASHVRKQFFLGALTVVIIVAGLVLLVAAFDPRGNGTGLFQHVAGSDTHQSDATIAVIGSGQANAPADTANLQILITASRSGYDIGRNLQPTPSGTPGTGEIAAAAPIVDSLMSTGLERGDIDVVSSPSFGSSICFNPGCPTPFRVDVTVHQPNLDQLTKIVNAAGQAADDNDLNVVAVGAGYAVDDCSTLQREARQAAIADAQNQAQQQADLLHLRLGNLISIGDVVNSGTGAALASGSGCGNAVASTGAAAGGSVSGLTVPSFDPKAPAVATMTVQVNLTYASA